MTIRNLLLQLTAFCLLWACNSNDDPAPPNKPMILEISPLEALPGVTVTIDGMHFTSKLTDLTVEFNGVKGTVLSADTFLIKAVVPEEATTGPIKVTVKNQTVTSSDVFTVLESPWERKADFAGGTRIVGVGFSIGNKGYAGTGVGDVTSAQRDFHEYDPAADTWTPLPDFPGEGIQQSIGFSIGSMGYVGLGTTGAYSTSIFYQFDPSTKSWTKKANYGGGGRSGAVAFSIGGKGYVATGVDSYGRYNDVWEYDPSADTWTRKADFPGGGKSGAFAFSIGDKGYVGGGRGNGTSTKDFWEYNAATDTWTRKADFPNSVIASTVVVENRTSAVAFSIGTKGYVCTGVAGNYRMKDVWEYDPATDKWTRIEDFPAASRSDAFGFAIGDKGYFGCGRASDSVSDFWELSF